MSSRVLPGMSHTRPVRRHALPLRSFEVTIRRQSLTVRSHALPVRIYVQGSGNALPGRSHTRPVRRHALPMISHGLQLSIQALPVRCHALPLRSQELSKYWWLVPLYWLFISHTILMMIFCRAHTVEHMYNILPGILLGGFRLDVDLELVFALEQN
jgi:hypothetical protein